MYLLCSVQYSVQAWDSDAGVNSQLEYSIVRDGQGRAGGDRFLIDKATGQVTTINCTAVD